MIPLLQTGEVVANELFVEAGGCSARLPVVGRPEAAAVGGQEFVDEQEISFGVGAELEFRIRQNDAGLFGTAASGGVKR